MASDRIDQLRTHQFPTERRGYDRRAVDSYLSELADWLESGGGDEARASVIQREMERVGERTGTILAAAQESADRIGNEAREEADKLRSDAEAKSRELRESADTYSIETRAGADAYSDTTKADADQIAAKSREEADEHARLTIREADQRAEQILADAERRKGEVEAEITDLMAKRGQITENLEQLVTAVRGVIDGPAKQDLGLPENVVAAAAAAVARVDSGPAAPVPPTPADETDDDDPAAVFAADDRPLVYADEQVTSVQEAVPPSTRAYSVEEAEDAEADEEAVVADDFETGEAALSEPTADTETAERPDDEDALTDDDLALDDEDEDDGDFQPRTTALIDDDDLDTDEREIEEAAEARRQAIRRRLENSDHPTGESNVSGLL
jgi:DivIVA domain-containing protein